MAVFSTYTVTDLSGFSGRGVSEYTNTAYVTTAVAQATLLFKLGTCLGDRWPDDPTMAELAKMAILSMADAIYLSQPFQVVLSNPFSSETIGSYSYSKVAGAVMGGLPTGIMWFDMAISKLSVCDMVEGIPMGGGLEIFENDGFFTSGQLPINRRLISPQDMNLLSNWGFDPSEGYLYTESTGSSSAPPSDDDDNMDGGTF